MSTYSLVADLPVVVDSYALEGLEQSVSSDFVRRTTVVHLRGGGEEGIGEDVVYDAEDQARFQAAGPLLDLAGEHTLDSLSARFEGLLDLRRWGFESAALDLALRQAGRSLHEVLGREPRPVTFVVSTSLPDGTAARLDALPGMRFKLDPEASWGEELVAELAALGAVDVVDFKEAYDWRAHERTPPASLYRLVVEALPDALIEDPDLTDPEKASILESHHDRISWDAPIHSVADVDALAFPPKVLNSKPSRFGSVKGLFDFYDVCAERGIRLYGGGQFELGPGRGHIQYLASLFHPEAANDVAPSAYNVVPTPPGLPVSPLPPTPAATGFRSRAARA
jgi:L-alanine-DL-glutamate epimerase-like enolase superfamily enzyme